MREIVERLTENRQIELAKSILESNGYKVTKKSDKTRSISESNGYKVERVNESSDYRTMSDGGAISDHASRYIKEYLKEDDPSHIYMINSEDKTSYHQLVKLLQRDEIKKVDKAPAFIGVSVYHGNYKGRDIVIANEFGTLTFYFTDIELLSGVPKRFSRDKSLDGTIYAKTTFDKKMILDLYNKGKEILASGKSVERVISDASSHLKELGSNLKKAIESSKTLDGAEWREQQRKITDIENEIENYYENNVVAVLVAAEQLKFVRGVYDVKRKPLNPEYYLNNMAGTRIQWYRYY